MLDKILALAEDCGLDQGELESLAGLARGRITKWKKGQGEITARQVFSIARVLGVTVDSIVDESSEPRPLADDSGYHAYIVQLIRDMGLTREEAVRRLTATPAGYVESADTTIRETSPPVRGPKRLGGERGKG